MKHQHQTTPSTNDGTANNYSEERAEKKKIVEKLEELHDNIEIEKMVARDNGWALPMVEAPREIIEYFNRGPLMKAFDKVGYFIYQGAAVCEKGKKDKLTELLEQSSLLMPDEWNKVKKN